MKNKMRTSLLTTTAFALALMLGAPAHAADTTALAKLQDQIATLQKQIDELKTSQAQTAAAIVAPVAPAPAAAAAPGTGTAADKLQAAVEQSTGVKVSVGGFFDMTAISRSKNEGTDTGTNYNTGIPFASSPNAHQSEFRATARNTRMNVLATAKPDEDTNLAGFFEFDFAGTGVNSSPVQTSNYTPRFRQGYISYERNDLGLHVLGGQAWSLVSQNSVGITPRKEYMPIGIDAGLVVGTVYAREAQLRVVKDFADKKVWAGLSLEAPSTSYGGITAPTNVMTNTTSNTNIANGVTSDDIAPDVVAKVAFDPGFGHYEIFGLGRTFHDRVYGTGYGKNNTVFAKSGGASVLFNAFGKKLDISANVIAGQAVGRYGASQLPDIAFRPDGGITPLEGYAAMFGLVGHATPTLDLYAYTGLETVMRKDMGSASTTYGYGNVANSTNCYVETSSTTACQAQTNSVWQVTGGAWKSVYNGNYGKLAVGLQESMTRRQAFSGSTGTAPHAIEYTSLASFRFTPAF